MWKRRNFGPKSGGYQFRRSARYVWVPTPQARVRRMVESILLLPDPGVWESVLSSPSIGPKAPAENGFTVI